LGRARRPAVDLPAGNGGRDDRVGLPYSQDWIFVWIVGLMLALSIGDGQHTVRRLIKDWLPIIVALLAYDLLRGVAAGNLFAIHWDAPVHADKILGLGKVPTVRLQDALYTPGHLHFWATPPSRSGSRTSSPPCWSPSRSGSIATSGSTASPPASSSLRRWASSPTSSSRRRRPGSRPTTAA
jgi:hypothetical protein